MLTMRRLWHAEEGIGVVTALMVVFVVMTLGGVWYGISVHELDEVTFDRHRTQSVHAADAGAREAMYLLSQPSDTVRNAAAGTGQHTSGITSGQCDLVALQSVEGGTPKTVGEYWFRITDPTPGDPDDLIYRIESWGWAPDHTARQADVKKVDLEVKVFPREGFQYALFGAGGGLSANNRKEIYGDVYSASDAFFSNNTSVFDNGPFPGDGDVEAYGSITIPNGSNVYIEGRVTSNGFIDDQNPGDTFVGDVIVVEDRNAPNAVDSAGHDAYFKDAIIGGVVKLTGTLKPSSDINGASLLEGATGLQPVALRNLPGFTWSPADYDPAEPIATYATWNDFLTTYYNGNKTSLTGAHYVQDSAMDVTWDTKNARFAKDFILVVDGKVTVKGEASTAASASPPVQVVVAGNQTTSKVTLAQNFFSSNDLRWLVYSKGQFEASQVTTIYGSVYAYEDVSSNKLVVHYRPPQDDIIQGFVFADENYDAEPGVWREIPADGLDSHCTLP